MNYFTVAVTLVGGRVCTRTVQFNKDVPYGTVVRMLKARAVANSGKQAIQITVTQNNYR